MHSHYEIELSILKLVASLHETQVNLSVMQSPQRLLHPEQYFTPDSKTPLLHRQSPSFKYLVVGHTVQSSLESQVLQRYGHDSHYIATPLSLNPISQVHVPSLFMLSSYV